MRMIPASEIEPLLFKVRDLMVNCNGALVPTDPALVLAFERAAAAAGWESPEPLMLRRAP